jgi:hypothetical protein
VKTSTRLMVESSERRLLGCAHLFRPTYAGANVGHPTSTFCLSHEDEFAGTRLFLDQGAQIPTSTNKRRCGDCGLVG